MKVLITGAAGQLGKATVREFGAAHTVVATTLGELDITDSAAVASSVRAERPDAVVNCAAFTDVDGAEDDPVGALKVNALAVRILAAAAASVGAAFVHYSTDFVFDGCASEPYTETDPPNPQSTYACSKLLGEWFAQDAPRHYVLRVESLFGGVPDGPGGRRTSVDRIVESIVAGAETRVFVDRTVSPSFVADVSRTTRELLERNLPGGLYHCVNSGRCTWEELALEVGRQLGRDARLARLRTADAKLKAARPRYCALANGKLAGVGIALPRWEDALARYLHALLG